MEASIHKNVSEINEKIKNIIDKSQESMMTNIEDLGMKLRSDIESNKSKIDDIKFKKLEFEELINSTNTSINLKLQAMIEDVRKDFYKELDVFR